MKPTYLVRVVSILTLVSTALTAQVARRVEIPLKNWAAPMYWQPNQAETQASEKAQPQLAFSANQVSASALTFIAITPCRLVDTRGAGGSFNGMSPFSGPSIAAAATVTFPVQLAAEATADTTPAPCGVIPSIAQAYSFNVTIVPQAGGAVDYISLWPAGGAKPFVATLNDPQGAIAGNAAIVPAGTPSGGVSIYNSGPATMDVIIDMNGFFAAPSDLNFNTAVGGSGALASNTTGADNTAVGSGALASNTTGSTNVAAGAGALNSNTSGNANTAVGQSTLADNTTGSFNTASGNNALFHNTTGSSNTASGDGALFWNSTGGSNTASGAFALQFNTTGANNTAGGYLALQNNTTGSNNTAFGVGALQNNIGGTNPQGNYNTASGYQALQNNTTGFNNTAFGYQALQSNTTGISNMASGFGSLQNNTVGFYNTGSGIDALGNNTTGSYNTASGLEALQNNTTGSNNIAVGYQAAVNVTGTNSNNIHIGNPGVAGDSGAIWIGTQGTQTTANIAGISGASASGGAAVYVTANGQLGTVLSSQRFKEQITDMGDTSNKLFQLRPVNFFYKPSYDDGSHLMQYGLIAEEVAKVYPEMVAYDNDGQILTVKYQLLAPMLLNEAGKQNARVEKLEEQNRKLEDRLAALEALLSGQSTTVERPAGSH